MPPKNKRAKQLEKARACIGKKDSSLEETKPVDQKEEQFVKKADAHLMAFAGISTGTGYPEQAKTLLAQGVNVPVASTYFLAQKEVCKQVAAETKEQCRNEALKIENGASLSEDGTWNHMKNGSAATVTVINQDTNKVVAYYVVQKSVGSFVGNFRGPSNMMESEGVRKVLEQLNPYIRDKLINFIHDNDNKTSKIIVDSTFQINDLLDPGHSVQAIERAAKTYFDKCADVIYREKNKEILGSEDEKFVPKMSQRGRRKGVISKLSCQQPYTALIPKLKSWFNYLVHNVDDIEQRKSMWLNTVNHLMGRHENCIHPVDYAKSLPGRPRKDSTKEKPMWEWKEGKNDEILEAQLTFFIGKTVDRLQNISVKSTQANESLNASISMHCPKNRAFTASVEGRVSLAIAKKNDPFFEVKFLEKHYKDRIIQKSLQKLRCMAAEKLSERILKQEPREHIRKNRSRIEKRKSNHPVLGDYKSHCFYEETIE